MEELHPSVQVRGETGERAVVFPEIGLPVFDRLRARQPGELSRARAARQFMMCRDGQDGAAIERGVGSNLTVVHARSSVEPQTFQEAELIHAGPERATVWGRRGGQAGLWRVTRAGIRQISDLPNLSRVRSGPFGSVAIGDLGNGYSGLRFSGKQIVAVSGTRLLFLENGDLTSLVPCRPYRGSPEMTLVDGPFVPKRGELLPFATSRVKHAFRYLGGFMYVLSDGERETFWHDGKESAIGPNGGFGTVDHVWSTSDGSRVAMLLHLCTPDGGAYRRLLVENKSVCEGAFVMSADDFRWSPVGTAFAAHVRHLDTDGGHRRESILSPAERVDFPDAKTTAYEFAVDDDGRLSYVYENALHGRRIVAPGGVTPEYAYAWNLCVREESAVVSANVLVNGQVHRIEIPHSR